jgi:CheY-like chemotaxis protein
VRWIQELLKEIPTPARLSVVRDGSEVLQFLRHSGPYRPSAPQLILLDLQLPRKDGLEVLAELQEDTNLSRIPVVILATSENDRDVDRSFALGAISYISKPVDTERLALVLTSIMPETAQGRPGNPVPLSADQLVSLLLGHHN